MTAILEKLTLYWAYPFVRYALIVGVLIALCSSLLGVTLVLKRFSFIGDGLSHVAFGAMAIAAVLQITNKMPLVMVITILSAVLLLHTGQNTKIKGDAAIAMISVGSLAIGYLLMNIFSTSSNLSGDVCSTLFGSTSIPVSYTHLDVYKRQVKSSDLFSGKAVTVVNFWFTTCGPCVGELGDLDALNKDLSGKGGALIGINAFTLDGNETAISDAKDVLTQSGATYQNVYFDSGSEAGKFVESIYAYPTTYVVNRSGRIVGDPIVGAITSKAQADALQAQIDKALAADMG